VPSPIKSNKKLDHYHWHEHHITNCTSCCNVSNTLNFFHIPPSIVHLSLTATLLAFTLTPPIQSLGWPRARVWDLVYLDTPKHLLALQHSCCGLVVRARAHACSDSSHMRVALFAPFLTSQHIHNNRSFKLSQSLVNYWYGINPLLHLPLYCGPKNLFVLIKIKLGEVQLNLRKIATSLLSLAQMGPGDHATSCMCCYNTWICLHLTLKVDLILD
jgi:hypothetical protein